MSKKLLVLEVNPNFVQDKLTDDLAKSGILLTPPLGDDYWVARVKIPHSHNYIIAFPKFSTFGIGFLKEKDGNTNLPYTCDAKEIAKHISYNKPKKALDQDCIKAIEMLQDVIRTVKATA